MLPMFNRHFLVYFNIDWGEGGTDVEAFSEILRVMLGISPLKGFQAHPVVIVSTTFGTCVAGGKPWFHLKLAQLFPFFDLV